MKHIIKDHANIEISGALVRRVALCFVLTHLFACGESPDKDDVKQPDAVEQALNTTTPSTNVERPPDTVDKTTTWATYSHPLGTEFRHPKDWQVQASTDGLRLLPHDGDPMREWIVATARPANGITDLLSEAAQAQMDLLVQMSMPFLRRTKAPRAIKTPYLSGAVYDYSGQSPDGRSLRACSYIAIVNGNAGALSLIAEEDLFDKRASIVETIFESLRANRSEHGAKRPTQTTIDARLVGRFQGEAIHSGSGVYTNTQLVWAFNSNGTVLYGAQTHMSASKRDYNGELEWTATGTSDGSVETGTWRASNGLAEIRWSNGNTTRFAYGFEPDGTLAVRNPSTRKLMNIYTRIR